MISQANRFARTLPIRLCLIAAIGLSINTSSWGQNPAIQPSSRERARVAFQQAMTDFYHDHSLEKFREKLSQVISVDPTYPQPYFNLGVLAASDRDWSTAI